MPSPSRLVRASVLGAALLVSVAPSFCPALAAPGIVSPPRRTGTYSISLTVYDAGLLISRACGGGSLSSGTRAAWCVPTQVAFTYVCDGVPAQGGCSEVQACDAAGQNCTPWVMEMDAAAPGEMDLLSTLDATTTSVILGNLNWSIWADVVGDNPVRWFKWQRALEDVTPTGAAPLAWQDFDITYATGQGQCTVRHLARGALTKCSRPNPDLRYAYRVMGCNFAGCSPEWTATARVSCVSNGFTGCDCWWPSAMGCIP